ncbi:transcriptional regulator [Flavobacterium terrisoli]|uniref:transcriptional regulator n=1 Tax=Flavobacterium terrisoli TaxID=3242195 RepID=UPI002542912A|nr:transcriptional regulator [Flavobacterium buctense]
MNYIKHLTGFFDKVAIDRTLNPTHISLYMSLFQFWNCNRFKNPISISRDEIMRISKISSKATYHKCLKALHSQGYIKYEPSYNPFRGSHVFMFNFSENLKPFSKTEKSATPIFEPVDEQVLNKQETTPNTSNVQAVEQALVPYINDTNNTNAENNPKISNLDEPEKKIEEEQFIYRNDDNPKEKDSAQKEKVIPPELDEILEYFRNKEYPEIEANKFFNYFKSIGWLVGGKTPMANWQAAANNWMLNAPKFISNERTDRSQQLDTSSGKDYSEPL